jgi:hypothetical protein
LAFGAGIHIAHADDDRMRLVVEVETVADELFEIDFLRSFEAAAIAPVASAPIAFMTRTIGPGAFVTRATARTIPFPMTPSTFTISTTFPAASFAAVGAVPAFLWRAILWGAFLAFSARLCSDAATAMTEFGARFQARDWRSRRFGRL